MTDQPITSEIIQTIKQTLSDLIRLHEPDREVDKSIARIFGWSVHSTVSRDKETGERSVRSDWYNPSGENQKVPRYTQNIDSALDLLREVNPDIEGGFSWEPGLGAAKFGDSASVSAREPAMSICIVAILLHAKKHRDGQD